MPKVQKFDFRKYSIYDHVHLELDFLRAVEYVSTHPNANDEIMNLYDSSFAKNAVRYVYSIIRCVNTVFQALSTVCYEIIGAYVLTKNWFNYILISRYVEYWIPLVKKQGSFILESVFFFRNSKMTDSPAHELIRKKSKIYKKTIQSHLLMSIGYCGAIYSTR